MLERYEIETLEQLRAIADVRRLRIVDLLREQPLTVTQLGERMGLAPAKVHYHVRELEKVGLLRLVETREKGGILEKYYQAIAREVCVPDGLLLTAPSDETIVN
jgi:DNA-binding transcriptional ArsR family regulator